MVAPLQQILDAELARGNTVVASSPWGPGCRLLVLLKRPFGVLYPTAEGVEYVHVDDPHYWKSEYRFHGGQEVLACGFE
jgi:hypothetical protein